MHHIPLKEIQSLEFALLHQDFRSSKDLKEFGDRQPYFRLIHRMKTIPAVELPEGFSFVTANPETEAQAISDFISACYEEIHPGPETVLGWCEHPVFDENLWVWIIDEARSTPAALGIAEFDLTIAEGSLEWIQVLPDYRCKGLGKQIVNELHSRLQNRAEFTTVASRVDNATHPEKLYRRCGFEGDDIWWVLQR